MNPHSTKSIDTSGFKTGKNSQVTIIAPLESLRRSRNQRGEENLPQRTQSTQRKTTEGGFSTRPYESHFFFAYFAFFAVESPAPNLLRLRRRRAGSFVINHLPR